MADEWWSSARTDDDGGGASACSTALTAADQDPAESAATSSTTTSTEFRPSLHVDDAAAPSSFLLADDPLPRMDWTQATYMGGRAAAAAEASSGGFNALLQLHGDAGRHFLFGQQPGVDAPAAAAPQSASMYAADSLYYSSYGDAAVTKPFSRQEFSGFFGTASTRNFGDMHAVPPPTTKPLLLQALEHKAFKSHKEPTTQVQDACSSVTRRAGVPDSPAPAKKPRIATPSPLPTFKVRKEKLGDRITALQQLVSPFGKTDTASVLHEAIEYIRFLHDQVASLSSPYLSCGRPVQQKVQQQQAKGDGEAKEDLRSRGLCLVPVANTYYAVASETAPEFSHPTFGGTFR